MKKFKMFITIISAISMILLISACSSPNSSSNTGDGGNSGGSSSAPSNPFDGTSWYGATKDFFTGEIINDVKLIVFDQDNTYGTTIYRCKNLEDLYFGGSDGYRLIKGQALPYAVEKKSDGSYVATTQLFKYSIVIPEANSTTGYISVEHNNQTLKIEITKK